MKWVKRLAVVIVLIAAVAASASIYTLRASLPDIDGDVAVQGLSAPVSVERDENGVPTLSAANHLDLARALGFVHGQERFFQMDLMRRRAAGDSIREALIKAVERRTRPILLTTATTVAGLLPLMLSSSSLWPPMASAMISGLIASTLLTLLAVPSLYLLLFEPRAALPGRRAAAPAAALLAV